MPCMTAVRVCFEPNTPNLNLPEGSAVSTGTAWRILSDCPSFRKIPDCLHGVPAKCADVRWVDARELAKRVAGLPGTGPGTGAAGTGAGLEAFTIAEMTSGGTPFLCRSMLLAGLTSKSFGEAPMSSTDDTRWQSLLEHLQYTLVRERFGFLGSARNRGHGHQDQNQARKETESPPPSAFVSCRYLLSNPFHALQRHCGDARRGEWPAWKPQARSSTQSCRFAPFPSDSGGHPPR